MNFTVTPQSHAPANSRPGTLRDAVYSDLTAAVCGSSLRVIRRKPRFAAFLLSLRRCANLTDMPVIRLLQFPPVRDHYAV
jgi:hypothetical protein